MSYKRSRSPPAGGSNYSRNVRGRGDAYPNQYDSRSQEYSRHGPPSGGAHQSSRQYSGNNGQSWESSYHRSNDRRSWPDFASDSCHHNVSRGGGVANSQSWALSTNSWTGEQVRHDYHQGFQSQLLPNPMYNSNPDRSHDWRRNGDNRRGRHSDEGYSRSGSGEGRGRHSEPYSRNPERRRIEISSRADITFLEEVDLPPTFAFRLDSSSDTKLLSTESTEPREMPSFFPTFYRDNVLGASEEYIKKNNIRSYLTKKDDKETGEEVHESPPPPPGTIPVPVRPTPTKTIQYISMEPMKDGKQKESKEELTTSEKREQLNALTRQSPESIQLWREFVKFQDEDCISMKRKARIEKKVAILEKALRTNPKSCELHFDRLDLLNEILTSADVVAEWEKLVAANEDSEAVWIERFKLTATQLQILSSSDLSKEFGKGFEKLRRMLSPSYPIAHSKPPKLHLLLPDLLCGLTLLLRNLGYTEKAVALCQAQLEFDFNFPEEGNKLGNDKSGWKGTLKLFELFWSLETLRFGEPGTEKGWNQILEANPETLKEKVAPTGIEDSIVQEFEDSFFEAINNSDAETALTRSKWILAQSSKWALVESMRSKLHWMPWRAITTDADDCEDTQRLISFEDVNPFLVRIPDSLPSFDMQSSYFRHIVNYLLLLAPDFLPRTHTLESILSPFSSLSLTDTSVFWSELKYWEKLEDLYHSTSKASHEISSAPEGFLLAEYTHPASSSIISDGKKLKLGVTLPDSISKKQQSVLTENRVKYHAMIRSVVTQSLNHLDSQFASLLVQTLFRFEQKSIYNGEQEVKGTMTFCKNLLKNEKVRDCIEPYMEIALLEYFGGKRKKAVTVLFKTLVSSTKLLRDNDMDDENVGQFLEENWEKVAGVTKLYRLLAEFHLKESKTQALVILTSLGNHFDVIPEPLDSTKEADTSQKQNTVSKLTILKAKRFFENVMNYLVPKEKEKGVIKLDCEEDEDLFQQFNKWDGVNCLENFGQKSNLIVEWTLAYALFSYLVDDTLEAASEIFNLIMDKLDTLEPLSRSNKYFSRIINCHNIREQLYINWCKLGALHVTLHPMQNSKFRNIFGKALELYPSSPPLLLLYMNVERQCSVVGKLWRSMVNTVKEQNSANFCTLDWAPIFMGYTLSKQIDEIEQDSEIALDEFGIGGPAVPPDTIFYKLDAIFTAAENNLLTQSCPLIWRLHLKHLAMRAKDGKDIKRGHGIFYDAIRRCPSSKALYMDAILYFPEMMKEVMDLMSQNEVTVRMPLEELHLFLRFNGKEDDEVVFVEPSSSKTKKKELGGKKKNRNKKKGKKLSKQFNEDDLVAVEIVSD